MTELFYGPGLMIENEIKYCVVYFQDFQMGGLQYLHCCYFKAPFHHIHCLRQAISTTEIVDCLGMKIILTDLKSL